MAQSLTPRRAQAPPRPELVGIGASAGGLRALRAFFEALPPKTRAAFVVVMHLDPDHESELPGILQKWTPMPVLAVREREPLKPDTVYVITPGRTLTFVDAEITASPTATPRGRRTPIDLFFRSIAETQGAGVAVVLSGSGSDGAVGVGAIREKGGLVLAQEPDDADFPSMPRAAIAVGADVVLPAAALARRLAALLETRRATDDAAFGPAAEPPLQRIFALLQSAAGHDFSRYKRPTVLRRIARRMQITHVADLDAYVARLEADPGEGALLFKDMLISVTRFFREPAAFEAVARLVVPQLFDRMTAKEPIRIWTPACATGEETYSLAILMFEEAERRGVAPNVQLFASDLDEDALAAARAGCYPAAIEADVSEARLTRFFAATEDGYAVTRGLRDSVIFTTHDVIADPPFARLDLISCRNLLIYLGRDLQTQVCRTFSYALRPGGVLFLGSSETVDAEDGLFDVVNREERLYQVRSRSRLPVPQLGRSLVTMRAGEPSSPPRPRTAAQSAELHRRALEADAPPSLLIDARHRVVNLSETAGRFLLHPAGAVTTDAVSLVRSELALDLRAALHRVFEHGERTVTLPIPVTLDGAPVAVVLLVRPAPAEDGAPAALAVFVEGGPIEPAAGEPAAPGDPTTVAAKLRDELAATRSLLRVSREQYEEATDELRASNEELQSVNEEHRATAEELETSKEELQSINEELQTVNGELTIKLDLVSRANNDLQNLMAATDIATLFLTSDLRIKRFTPRTTELFNLHPGDEGRPIADFSHRLDYADLAADALRVLATLEPIERSIGSTDGRRFTTRLRPYRTVDDRIDGVVVTFFDVTEKHAAEAAWSARQAFLLGELNHRAKNTLAVVQALVGLSLRREEVPASIAAELDGRLQSLARSHRLLLATDWKGADLRDLVEGQAAPHAAASQLTARGPRVLISADCATPLGLVLNELATNAAKYGALSARGGRVDLAWRVLEGEAAGAVEIDWVETGGPAVRPPKTTGLGTRLIEHSVPGSRVELSYEPAGFRMRMRLDNAG